MLLRKTRPEPINSPSTNAVPDLTHQSSSESINSRSPITPNHDTFSPTLSQKPNRFSTFHRKSTNPSSTASHPSPIPNIEKDHSLDTCPLPPPPSSAPVTRTEFLHSDPDSPKVPPKDLAFLSHDPFAKSNHIDDDIPFDKNKPITSTLSRSKSSRSVLSTNSLQSLKSGLSFLKRKLTRRSRSRPAERKAQQPGYDGSLTPGQHLTAGTAEEIGPMKRTQTYMIGPTLHQPRRVDTFQISAMVI